MTSAKNPVEDVSSKRKRDVYEHDGWDSDIEAFAVASVEANESKPSDSMLVLASSQSAAVQASCVNKQPEPCSGCFGILGVSPKGIRKHVGPCSRGKGDSLSVSRCYKVTEGFCERPQKCRTWTSALRTAFASVLGVNEGHDSCLPKQQYPLSIHSGCSGTGAATLSLKAG